MRGAASCSHRVGSQPKPALQTPLSAPGTLRALSCPSISAGITVAQHCSHTAVMQHSRIQQP